MTPANIVGMAALKELDLIAVTDHNSCKNCPAVLSMAESLGITALPGMELTTSEEIHVICLFAALQDAMAFDEYVYQHLAAFPNNEAIFGKQQIYGIHDTMIGTIPNLLINATTISFDDVYDLSQTYHGIMIPAHIDKTSNSLLASLGAIPPDSRFTCAEIKDMHHYHKLKKQHPYLEHCHIISNSDAHYLQDINEPYYTLPVRSRSPKDILDALTHT